MYDKLDEGLKKLPNVDDCYEATRADVIKFRFQKAF